ncbi:hypothetical protein Tco_0605339 [Tanacetum coccineum]
MSETILTLENFAQILRIPCEGVCLYSHEWSIASLQRSLDPHPNLYPHPIEELSLFNLVDHVMIPLSNKRKNHIKTKGKRPRLPTPTPSNSSGSSQSPPNQGTSTNPRGDPIDNNTLDPMAYLNQLSVIEGGESPEFKQTKGLFKCLFYFLCKKK